MLSERRPIGYWLKHLDQQIELTLDQVLARDGLSRRGWQVMNVLHRGPTSNAGLVNALGAFWAADAARPDHVLGDLVRLGWAERDTDERYRLTAEGEGTRAELAGRVAVLRKAMTNGVTAAEYAATVDTLRRMTENLRAAA